MDTSHFSRFSKFAASRSRLDCQWTIGLFPQNKIQWNTLYTGFHEYACSFEPNLTLRQALAAGIFHKHSQVNKFRNVFGCEIFHKHFQIHKIRNVFGRNHSDSQMACKNQTAIGCRLQIAMQKDARTKRCEHWKCAGGDVLVPCERAQKRTPWWFWPDNV